LNINKSQGYDERTLLFVMEAFIAANRALIHGIEESLKGEQSLTPHYCPGNDCGAHRAAFADPLRRALSDNSRLGDFISEVLAGRSGERDRTNRA